MCLKEIKKYFVFKKKSINSGVSTKYMVDTD